jgi:hypothetical protein
MENPGRVTLPGFFVNIRYFRKNRQLQGFYLSPILIRFNSSKERLVVLPERKLKNPPSKKVDSLIFHSDHSDQQRPDRINWIHRIQIEQRPKYQPVDLSYSVHSVILSIL